MRRKAILLAAPAAIAAVAAAGCGGGGAASGGTPSNASARVRTLTGAGSTLVAPLMSKWQADFQSKKGVQVIYGAIGSGGGIAQVTAKTVDFGASDAPLTPDQKKAAGRVVQIPWALAATDVAYHVRGAPKDLKLSGPLLADIFLGKVTRWNDPAIARLNPGARLPATKITPVYRSDGSGDTYAFTDYLSKVSPEWKAKVGSATQVAFPAGLSGKGNDGVAAVLSGTDGAIGYLAISYVDANGLDAALVQNAAGKFPKPSPASIAAAAAAVKRIPAGNTVSIVDPPASAPGAYPISTYTYAIIPAGSPKAGAAAGFVRYAITSGQQYDVPLDFAPLPGRVVKADTAALAKLG